VFVCLFLNCLHQRNEIALRLKPKLYVKQSQTFLFHSECCIHGYLAMDYGYIYSIWTSYSVFWLILALLSVFLSKSFFLFLYGFFGIDLSDILTNNSLMELVITWGRGMGHFSMLFALICLSYLTLLFLFLGVDDPPSWSLSRLLYFLKNWLNQQCSRPAVWKVSRTLPKILNWSNFMLHSPSPGWFLQCSFFFHLSVN